MVNQRTLIILGIIAVVAIAGAYYVGVTNQPPAPPPPVKDNVIQALTKAGNFNTFLQAIDKADLTTMLTGAGPYTVFAPTDAAFAKMSTSDLNALLADKQRLIKVISYHIVSGHFTSSELANPMIKTLRSAQGSNLVISGNKVEKATFVTKDIALTTSNSVIHSIDTVLMVPLRLLTISTVGLGLKNIQPATYEMWMTEGGQQTSLGKFSIDSQGVMHTEHFGGGIDNTFHRESGDFSDTTSFAVTIEAPGDVDNVPSGTVVLQGAVTGSTPLGPRVEFTFPTAFTGASGSYILATPTDGNNTLNERSGVWFLDPSGPKASLTLPALPAGWVYSGWVWVDSQVISGPPGQAGDVLKVPITIGRFTSAAGADNWSRYSEVTAAAPPFPGEDFLQDQSTAGGKLLDMSARDGGYPLMNIVFPLNLADGVSKVSITVQPDIGGIDPQGVGPSFIQILVASIPNGATAHTVYTMNLDLTSIPKATGDLSAHD